MAKKPISITLDEDMLERLDALAELEGTTRTAIIERALRNDLPEQEWYNHQLENPIIRALHAQMTRSPAILKALTAFAEDKFTDEKLAEFAKRAAEDRERARQRTGERRKAANTPKPLTGEA